MDIYFFTTVQMKNFLFKDLNIKNVSGLVGACFVVFFATALFESLKLVKMYIQLKLKQNPLTYGLTDHMLGDRSQLLSAVNSTTNLQKIASIRLKFHFYGCMMHMIYLFCAYVIMLIFMTYSVWLGLSIVLGSGAGHFIFGAIGHELTKKYTKMACSEKKSTCRSKTEVNSDEVSTEPCHM